MRKVTCHIETFEATWNGIRLEISWEPDWLGIEARHEVAAAHLQVRSHGDEPLPITETGYRSHFTSRSAVAAAGGPVAHARAWLDAAPDTPAWRRKAAAACELTLF